MLPKFSIVACVGLFSFASPMLLRAQSAGGRGTNAAQVQQEAKAQSDAAIASLNGYLNELGYAQLARRAEAVAALNTPEQALRRQADVRQRIIDLVGGVPVRSGPVNVKQFARHAEEGFTLENIAYESALNYWVTANVYVPIGDGPFPALIIAPGHGAGKSNSFNWAANFARAGVLVLAIDPMGQGERLQHFDPELGTSKVEFSGEHEHANQAALLVGHHIARYWFADGIRGVDYLISRPDVMADRIGTFGCSGGGTAAAYLMAMDPRVRVGVASSFITSFKELLPGNGPQDAEQTLPWFLASGLDFADWVELAAPRAFAIACFDEDFFPVAGARWTYDEAKKFYGLLGAKENIVLINGPGGHCNLGPVMPHVLAFLMLHLQGAGAAVPTFTPLRVSDPDALTVTPTGQVATSVEGAVTAEDLARAAEEIVVHRPVASASALARLQAKLSDDVRALAGIAANPGETVKASVVEKEKPEGYRIDAVTFATEPGLELEALIAVPEPSGPWPAILWLDAAPLSRTAANADFVRLAKAGHLVMAFHPRGVLGEPPPNPNQLALGQYMQPLLRSLAVGKTIVGMRVDDTIRAISYIASRPDVDASRITVYGRGAQGLVALHAAVLEPRIRKLVMDGTLVSYRAALQAGLHRNLSELVIPGVLKRYDTVDLLQAISPRTVIVLNPANAMGQPLRSDAAHDELLAVFESDRLLGTPNRVRIAKTRPGDPLPIE